MKPIQILVVEDEPIVSLDIESVLKSLDYFVLPVATSGREAIRMTEQFHPDLVLMDIRLKGEMDGVDAAERIHSRMGIPVVYLTAHADESTVQRAKGTEPFGYLLKPFEKEELHTVLQVALHKHKIDMQLKEREQWLAAILKSTGDAIVATDPKGDVVFMNPEAESLTQWSAADARGKQWRDGFKLVDELAWSLSHDVISVFQGQQNAIVLPNHTALLRRDGTQTPVSGSVVAMYDEKMQVSGVVLAFHDITEHKKMEQEMQHLNERLEERVWERTAELTQANKALNAEVLERRRAETSLRSSETKFRSIAESASDTIMLTNDEGKIVYCNESGRKLFLYGEQEISGRNIRDLIRDLSPLETALDAVSLQDGENVSGNTIQLKATDKNGREFPAEVSLGTWVSDNSRFFSAILRDVSERKKLEEIVLHSEKLAAMGRMAAGFAHEFATPLSIIRGYAEVVLTKLSGANEVKPMLEMIMKQTIRCGGMVQSLLTFSRKGKAGAKRFDLNEAIRPALLLIESQARVKTVEIKRCLDDSAMEVHGYPDQIEQVIINIAGNAFDAMPEGGTLTVKTEKAARRIGDFARIILSDTGAGIPLPVQEKLFEPFVTTKAENKGTGLGLWITRQIVTQHGGTIRCTSQEGRGTSFCIELPLIRSTRSFRPSRKNMEEIIPN